MEMLAGVSDPEAFACALAERAFLVRPGSELFHAVGVYARLEGHELVLRAAYYAPGREEPFAVVVRGDRKEPGSSAFVRLKNWTCADGVRSSAFSGADRDKKKVPDQVRNPELSRELTGN